MTSPVSEAADQMDVQMEDLTPSPQVYSAQCKYIELMTLHVFTNWNGDEPNGYVSFVSKRKVIQPFLSIGL